MGGGGNSTKDKQLQLAQAEVDLANKQDARADKMFNLAFPGTEKATKFYTDLSSGDPDLIAKTMAPASEQITQNANSAKQTIRSSMPSGGEKRLAEEMVDANAAAQRGTAATKSWLSAFPALASMSGQNIGLSINQVANAISSMGVAGNNYESVAKADAANKASTMGFLGSLGEGVAGIAAAACWIAEVLFGKDDRRTHLLRYWLNEVWAKRSRTGKVVMWAYRRWGRQVARQLERHPWAQVFFRPLFNYALAVAQSEMSGLVHVAV